MTVSWSTPVYVLGAAALSPWGLGWRGLAARVGEGGPPARREVPPLAPEDEPCEPRQRKLMSRAAYLAAAVVRAALRAPAVAGAGVAPEDVGCFLGVGASGGDMTELEAMLRESVDDGALHLGRFGDGGLRAANPLFAFQLMNNFSLCHAAILSGLQGPNAAFFSRGAGTVTALREAAFAVAGGEAGLAVAGGADSALHPVTALELARGRRGDQSLPLGEGAAVVALSQRPSDGARIRLVRAEVLGEPLDAEAATAGPAIDVTVASDEAGAAAIARIAGSQRLNVSAALGETLAAGPALGWVLALDWLAGRPHGRARVLSAGVDGDVGLVELVKEPA